jgi:hypothetical protein
MARGNVLTRSWVQVRPALAGCLISGFSFTRPFGHPTVLFGYIFGVAVWRIRTMLRGMSEATPSKRRAANLQRTTAVLGTRESAGGWAPILTALAIDLADLAMIGPTGLVAGFWVGFVLTSMLTLATGVPLRRALVLSLLAGIYCLLPFTDLVPLATMLTLLRMALLRRSPEPSGPQPASNELAKSASTQPSPHQR